MSYNQHIPFYIHKFKDFPWKQHISDHYVFNVEADSLADKEIEFIKTRQESAYKKIISNLELEEVAQKITYYFYPSQEMKAELMGDGWYGQSIYDEFTVHAIYNGQDKVVGEHEDTHLLTLQLGFPISFLQEGIAEAMVGKSMFGNEHNDVVREGVEKGITINVRDLMSQQGWLDTPDEEAEFYYSVAGSFTRYFLDTIGVGKFKKLYSLVNRENSKEENLKIFESVVGKDLNTVENQWRRKFLGEV